MNDDTSAIAGFLRNPLRVLVRSDRPVRLQWQQEGCAVGEEEEVPAGYTPVRPPVDLATPALLRVVSRPVTPGGLVIQAVLSEHRLLLHDPPRAQEANFWIPLDLWRSTPGLGAP